MRDELTEFSAARLADLIRRREVSPVEVVGAHLRRVERVNPTLNAVVALAPDALERAREAGASLARGGDVGALHGVPLTVKDTIEVRGLRATAGTRVREGFAPETDAPAVARLRAAGAIVLGKTNCAEMALDYTSENPVFGRTLNPHDAERTPGGSSGGCAAAVSAFLTPGSLGSDLVGSVRVPAHFCGVAGLKPTAGRVPGDGHFPPLAGLYTLGASLGPLARTVEDLGLLFDVLKGRRGVRTSDERERRRDVDERTLRGVRVAWYAGDEVVPVSDDVVAAVKKAASALEAAGLRPTNELPPGVEKGTELWLALFSEQTRRVVGAAYAGREGGAGPAARAVLERASKARAQTLDELLDAWAERDRLRAQLLRWMEETPLLVAPVGSVAAFRHDESKRVEVGGESIGTFRAFGYSQAFNVFDLPAACVPAGRTREGLPVGVQIVGRPFEEETVLAAARLVEEALGRG